jgi:archaemetzincin
MAAFAGTEETLIVTDRDLTTLESRQLFGFADARRKVAIVSSFRLDDGSGDLTRRLSNTIAHERGHLAGLRHCPDRQCLMHAAAAAKDLDTRPGEACGRCPRRGWLASAARLRGELWGELRRLFRSRSGAAVRP